jgi:two-component system OmpR family sensor kinase
VLLLAVVCTGIGVATELALKRFLSHQLDDQLLEAGRRSAAIFDMPPPPFAGPLRLPSPRVEGRSPDFPGPSPGLPRCRRDSPTGSGSIRARPRSRVPERTGPGSANRGRRHRAGRFGGCRHDHRRRRQVRGE